MSTAGSEPSPIRSPLKSIGALSFSPSPITTTPSMWTLSSMCRIASTAAASAPSLSPRPIMPRGAERGRLGDADELEREVAIGRRRAGAFAHARQRTRRRPAATKAEPSHRGDAARTADSLTRRVRSAARDRRRRRGHQGVGRRRCTAAPAAVVRPTDRSSTAGADRPARRAGRRGGRRRDARRRSASASPRSSSSRPGSCARARTSRSPTCRCARSCASASACRSSSTTTRPSRRSPRPTTRAAGSTSRCLVMITVGTGIGGGIVIDGRAFRGATGAAGEVGHTLVAIDGVDPGRRRALPPAGVARVARRRPRPRPPRARGRRGAPGLGARAPCSRRAAPSPGPTRSPPRSAGDAVAIECVATLGRRVGIGVANMINTFDPEVVAIGGGVSSAGDLLLAPARAAAARVRAPGRGHRHRDPDRALRPAGRRARGRAARAQRTRHATTETPDERHADRHRHRHRRARRSTRSARSRWTPCRRRTPGIPGTPMALAPLAYTLYTRVMRHNPADAAWPNRDRFVLSCGHASMLLYSILYLCGYGLELDGPRELPPARLAVRRPSRSTAPPPASRRRPVRSARASRRASASRSPSACSPPASTATGHADHRPPHLHDRLRRRHGGGHPVRGRRRSPAISASAA